MLLIFARSFLRSILEHFEVYIHNPINLFKCVINPQNFAQSVENVFNLSFLIRDGRCSLKLVTESLSYEPGHEEHAECLKRRQMVLELDMETWKVQISALPLTSSSVRQFDRCGSQRAIQVFNITESFIPQRAPAQTGFGDKCMVD
ncbi:hypothetical protein CVT25_002651 [Psilocybe cyanescens]|uniref:Non-structural maintenance of chromosomes element 4 n=1 Tax=Psilocybe cyanescens TaxID=93625 RepID=A0A409WLP2_PSICY|nr:hypothetical protein CVT25_002651 [Psilocybe cyanescens]